MIDPQVRRALVLARTELRTSVRSVLNNGRRLLASLFVALGGGLYVVTTLPVAHRFGTALAADAPPIGTLTSAFAIVVGLAAYGGFADVAQGDGDAARPLVWTSVGPSTAILGAALANAAKLVGFVAAVTAAPLVTIGAGARDPLLPMRLVLAALPLLWIGVLVGRVVGVAGQRLWGRVARSPWITVVAAVLVFGGGMVLWMHVVQRGLVDDVAATIGGLLADTPLDAYVSATVLWPRVDVHLLAAATPLVVLLLALVTTAGAIRIEAALDRRDGADRRRSTATSRSVPGLARWTRAGPIAWHYLLLGIRNPTRFAHLAPLAYAVAVGLAPVVTRPSAIVDYGLEGSVVLGLALAGGTYCLNPLGADRDQHALLLTSVASSPVLLRGRAFAGVIAGLLPIVLVGVPLGVLDGRPVPALAFLLVAPLLLAAGAGTALGFGAVIPVFERAEIGTAIQTSTIATGVYLAGSLVVGLAAVLLVHETIAGSLPPLGAAVLWFVFCALIGPASIGGYLYARRRLGQFTLDEY